ncbi:MAG: dTDP-4-dehydrorhamnose 3,5-epimerase [Gammaproteobacteria bacterium]|nr:MAG: dTDP-4-dehydrorhamnose 3,5-epimerase [Gammaproteobacteria bacterium]
MKVANTSLQDVRILTPTLFKDDRGHFYESYNQKLVNEALGKNIHFVQDNHSHSARGVLRGLHYQVAPMAQAKLVRVVLGSVFSVVVDVRPESSTYCRWIGIELSSESGQQLWIPEGFANGFYVLSDSADYLYKTTNYYSPTHERTISWDDANLDIRWPLTGSPTLSPKDACAPALVRSITP